LNIDSDENKVKVLATHYADLQIRSTYIQINSSIFNSQLLLLQALNTQTSNVELSFFDSYYKAAKNSHPDQYETYSFEAWLNYMKSSGLIITEDEKYIITAFGRGFLTALTEAGVGVNTKRMY
jgi:predicted transcriptional regulator